MHSEEKMNSLKQHIKSLGSALIAFSGGVDSTFLLAVSKEVLNQRVLAVTAIGPTYPQRESMECVRIARKLDVNYLVVNIDPFKVAGFSDNPPERCYLCKYQLFSKLKEIARDRGFEHVADGSNVDDLSDIRPGLKALRELGIASPLLESGLNKSEIRQLSRQMRLETSEKPAAACLSSRFVHGERISNQKLKMVEAAEDYLLGLGIKQVRVRMHQDLARIEVGDNERHKLLSEAAMDKIDSHLRQLGFRYITLDMQGYRTGSMNSGQVPSD
ncbi:MAG TPA: ATP-dependent sacrificial sulfur transferase LarE [Syntrophomonas sp.]|jgi:uncharacterized protein|nr:ATP-dependent sacrificial sulfur transferase LarE [Syntrophomonas sp.]